MTLRRTAAAVIFAAMIAIPLIASSAVVTSLSYIGLYAIVCIGLVLLTGIGGLVSFGQAAFVGIGAYVTAYGTARLGLSPWITLPALLLVTSAVAYGLGWLTIRLSSHYLVLGTMAWGLSLYYMFGNLQGLGGYNGIAGVGPILLFGLNLTSPYAFYVSVWVVVAVILVAASNLLASRTGRAMRCLPDVTLAESLGIDTAALKIKLFVISALLAALGGWLQAHYLGLVNPSPFGINASIDYLFMVVVGGTSSLVSSILGPAVVETLRNSLRNLLPSLVSGVSNYEAAAFGILIIILMQRARGGLDSLIAPMLLRQAAMAPADATPLSRPSRTKPQSPILVVDSATKRFGGLVAVNDVSFSLASGQILGLIGPNGAGKSTLFDLITGVTELTSGRIAIAGHDVSRWSSRRISAIGVARTFQHVRLRPDLTVIDNVAMGAYLRGDSGILAAALRLNRREEVGLMHEGWQQLARVGLGHQAGEQAGNLPLGQQRIVEVARALASDPQLLLLDEPAAGLRHKEKEQLAEILRSLRRSGLSILLVEHDMEFVMGLVDELVVVSFGQKICEGRPGDVQKDPNVIRAYLGGTED